MAKIGAVEREAMEPGGDRQRWPCCQAEVSMDDVELLAAVLAA